MSTPSLRKTGAATALLLAFCSGFIPHRAQAQFASVLETNSRYAGNSTGAAVFTGDTGTASSTGLNTPSYAVFDSLGNLFVSDTGNNCVRKISTSGTITTVAGLRVSGAADTCNTSTNASPTAAQGLLRPTGLAIDSANTLYIADSQHNCVRSLASGAVDSFAANALTTVAGTCSSIDTASVTPIPNGLAFDSSANLYISLQDVTASSPVNQVVRHTTGAAATAVCLVSGQPSASVAALCPGITSTVSLASPAALAVDTSGNLFIADTNNSCVREVAGLTTQTTAAGQCLNDHTGSSATLLHSPYGVTFSPTGFLYISEIGLSADNVVSFAPGSSTLTLIAGLPSGTAGPYIASTDGFASISSPLNSPLGLTTDSAGNIYLADSLNNIVRELSTDTMFTGNVGAAGTTQTINFGLSQPVSLSTTSGTDYTVTGGTCGGALAAGICQVTVRFNPTLAGIRYSPLRLADSLSGKTVSIPLEGIGTGAMGVFNSATIRTVAGSLRKAAATVTDSAGNAYVLEQGNDAGSADVLEYPAAGGAVRTVIAAGSGLIAPTAMAIDGAGNIFIVDSGTQAIARFGADGSANIGFVTSLSSPTAVAVDGLGNLFVAQADSVHNVLEIYASGTRRILAGSGTIANADGVAASSALFVAPGSVFVGLSGTLFIADTGGHRVYSVDSSGLIHIVAGNGTTTTSNAGVATATGLLSPISLTGDAAGDLYVVDQAANRIYVVYPVTTAGINIGSSVGTGVLGYTGDGGLATQATLQAPLSVSIDGTGDVFVVDSGNNAFREATFPLSPTLNFGHVIVSTTSPVLLQGISNLGNVTIVATSNFVPTDPHYAVVNSSTTCSGTLIAGSFCNVGFTFAPTVLGTVAATATSTSNSSTSPQTVQLTGYGLYTQALPYSLVAQNEVYGQPFSEIATLSLTYPDLVPTGNMTYTIAGKTVCSINGPFPSTSTCPALGSALGVGTYVVIFTYTSSDDSYFSTTSSTTLTVTRGSLSVTPANVSKRYGDAIPTLPATIAGTVNGDSFLVSDATTATPSSPIGSYPINATLTGVGLATVNNYNVTYNVGTLTVTPLTLTVTPNAVSRTYGAANPALSGTITGNLSGDTFTATYASSAMATSPIGTYPITATVTGSALANYTVVVTPVPLTVTPAPLSVLVANASRMYGGANPTFASSITGALNGDTFTNSFSTVATASSPVGTYPITDTLGGASNYSVTVTPGTLTVTQTTTALTIAVNPATRAYGSANPAFTSTVTGALNGDTFGITYATSANASSSVGSYSVVPTVTGTGNYANVTATPGTLTVTPVALTVTPANATRTYGAANPTFTGTIAGAVNGDTFTTTYTTTATAASPVGTYPITATLTGTNRSNYTVTVNAGTLTITPSTATLTFAANNASRGYGAANPTFSSTITGALNGDTFTLSYATSANASSPAGTYSIVPTVSGAALGNYSVVTTTNGTLTVTAATLNVTIANASRQYGQANPTFTSTVTGAVNGDTFTVSYSTSASAASPVGTYTIGATVAGANVGNYTVTVTPGATLTITPSTTPLVVTANNATRFYGAANPAFSSTVIGALNGDTFTVTYATPASTSSPVGTYAVVPTLSGPAAANYANITSVIGTLTITPAPLTVTVANASRAYGSANPTFTSSLTGALPADTFTVTYSTTAIGSSAPGAYPITATIAGANLANYTYTIIPGTLAVTLAPLTVSVSSASRPYATANPTFTATITGAVAGDTFTNTFSTSATITSSVGTYPVSDLLGGTAAANYSVTVVPGTLTITPATVPVTVTPVSVSRPYGSANPAFTSTSTGLLNGDTLTVTYTTTATSTSPVGTYPIVPTVSGAAAANYTIVPASGALTVVPAPLTVIANSFSRAYAVANPTLNGNVTGLLNGDTVTASYATTATVASPVGTYPIVPTISGAAAANYTVLATSGVLTITAAINPLAVAVNSTFRAFGAANPAFTSAVAGLLNGDTVTISYSSTVTAASSPGVYPLTATVTGSAASNYTVVVTAGTLTVTPAATTTAVTTSAATFVAGNSVTFTATVTSPAGTPPGTVGFYNGSTLLGTGTLSAAGVATFTTSGLTAATYTITATYQASTNFLASSGSVGQIVTPGSFTIVSTAPQYIRGPGVTSYVVTVTSVSGFNGPVTLTCSGLPSDAACSFAPLTTLTLAANGTATTTLNITTTLADAKLLQPRLSAPSQGNPGNSADLLPITVAAIFPFELSGLGVLIAGCFRRKNRLTSGKRLLLLLFVSLGILGLSGCGCFTSAFQVYTVTITGTSTVIGTTPQTTTVTLTVGQQ